MKIVTADEMREVERRSEAAGVSTVALMEHAGQSVAAHAQQRLGSAAGRAILVLVGPGNNGGDGLVAARALHDAGASVTLYVLSRKVAQPQHLAATGQRGIAALYADDDPGLAALRAALERSDLVVDAVLGTGRTRAITGLLAGVLTAVNDRPSRAPLLAVDLPTGLNADTGAVEPACLRADHTLTLGFPKAGLFLFPGASYVGCLAVGDIGLPPHIADDITLEMIAPETVARLLPARPLNAHKGTFGKVMVAGGSPSYVGAPVLASLSAGRVGAGLVTLACARTLQPLIAAKLVEATFQPLPDIAPGVLAASSVAPLLRALVGYDVLLLGPGLGRADQTVAFVQAALASARPRDAGSSPPSPVGSVRPPGAVAPAPFGNLTCLVDADGLNALATVHEWCALLPPRSVLTPHSGEMARLLGADTPAVNADRLGYARSAAARWSAVVVLKGAFTIVAAPDGRASVNPVANAALASAGTGDVLAGAIAGLMAQGLTPYDAAVAGVYLHARAGQLASVDLGDAGLLASDLLPLLPRAIKDTKALLSL